MLFNNRQLGTKTVIEIGAKDLDSSIATDLKNHLIATMRDDAEGITIVDLSNVRFLDSTCLGALIAAFRQVGSNRRIALAGAQEAVGHVLEIARVGRVMVIMPSVAEALNLTADSWAIGR